jgi:hypothetical protein
MARIFLRTLVAVGITAATASVPTVAEAAAAPPRDITVFGCPTDADTPFTDVEGTVHEVAIECLYPGVATGTSMTTYSPSANVTRGQLASLLARALASTGFPLDPADAGFTDLGGSVHTDAINALANVGVVTGRTSTTFAPDATATRAQTASVLARTVAGDGVLPESPPDAFTDDEGATAHEASINGLAAVGIVGGVTADRYDPDGTLSRGAAASFLARLFDFAVEAGLAPPSAVEADLAAAMTAAKEVPGPGDGNASGAVGILDGGLPGLLCVQWDIDGPLTSAPMAAHVHTGARGVAGPILFDLPTPEVGPGERLFSRQCVTGVDEAEIDAVLADPHGHYVNVHSAAFPNGALRGQLAAFESPVGTVLTDAEEAPGPGESGAGGQAFVDVHDDDRTVCSFVIYEGQGAPTAVHVHEGAPGVAGPIVLTLPPFDVEGPVSDGCVDAGPVLGADIAANPAKYYVNVHTTQHPDGAVRGQLQRGTFLDTGLSGAAEVPGPGDADGEGFAFLDVIGDGRVCVDVGVALLDRVVAAHIHRGTAGVAGPVVVTLAPPIFGFAGGCVDVATSLLDEIVANPSGFYVNVHTAGFPDGAVRGQLAPATA